MSSHALNPFTPKQIFLCLMPDNFTEACLILIHAAATPYTILSINPLFATLVKVGALPADNF